MDNSKFRNGCSLGRTGAGLQNRVALLQSRARQRVGMQPEFQKKKRPEIDTSHFVTCRALLAEDKREKKCSVPTYQLISSVNESDDGVEQQQIIKRACKYLICLTTNL